MQRRLAMFRVRRRLRRQLMRRAGQAGWEIDRVLDDDAAALYCSGWVDEALAAQTREAAWTVEDDEALTRLLNQSSS